VYAIRQGAEHVPLLVSLVVRRKLGCSSCALDVLSVVFALQQCRVRVVVRCWCIISLVLLNHFVRGC
jgi:hypothetical protein